MCVIFRIEKIRIMKITLKIMLIAVLGMVLGTSAYADEKVSSEINKTNDGVTTVVCLDNAQVFSWEDLSIIKRGNNIEVRTGSTVLRTYDLRDNQQVLDFYRAKTDDGRGLEVSVVLQSETGEYYVFVSGYKIKKKYDIKM